MKKLLYFLPFLLCMCTHQNINKIESNLMELTIKMDPLTHEIEIAGKMKNNLQNMIFSVDNSLLNCTLSNRQTPVIKKKKDGIEITRELVNDSLNTSCELREWFSFNEDGSLNCQISIRGNEDSFWDTSIDTKLHYPGTANFWTAWAAPNFDEDDLSEEQLNVIQLHDYDNTRNTYHGWRDPLVSVPFSDVEYYYGAPAFEYEHQRIGFIPFQENLFSIPIASILDKQANKGLSIILSPADIVFDMVLETKEDGNIRFRRLFNRISNENTIEFNYDIVVHEDDWRSGLAWMRDKYKTYFYPINKNVFDLDGTGAYSESNFYDVEIDVEKMRKMCFTTNWQASFDFPYMGMFIPPVKDKNERWPRFNHDSISINEMNQSVKNYKENGFSVLSYFNVFEFGARILFPYTLPDELLPEKDRWKDANQTIYTRFKNAILPKPEAGIVNAEYKGVEGSVPYYTWKRGVAMDCADPVYQGFLLKQLRKHMANVNEAAGICIDRLDWIRMFNEKADDGISSYKGKKTRSLLNSWQEISDSISAIVHSNNKVVLVNNHSKRIDILKNVDGIFDEFTFAGTSLNLTAFLCINKPALGWTAKSSNVTSVGGDSFMQKYLYMGVFPMCPFPGNDHSIHPSEADIYYLDYGPLMKLMQGAEWVLKPHAVRVANGEAKVNLFKIESGYSIPVIHAMENTVEVILKDIVNGNGYTIEVFHPGDSEPVIIQGKNEGEKYIINVPVIRKCAMVHLKLNA